MTLYLRQLSILSGLFVSFNDSSLFICLSFVLVLGYMSYNFKVDLDGKTIDSLQTFYTLSQSDVITGDMQY